MSLRDFRPTVMVADDYDDNRLMLRIWLERKGCRVVEAANGLDAISLVQQELPDLVLMDIEMPELDGLMAARSIREMETLPAVPIIALSAYGVDEYRELALAAGCTDYVTTPFSPEQLEEVICNLLLAAQERARRLSTC